MNRFESAKARYAQLGVDVETALQIVSAKPISIHCWQGDDVVGFDQPDGGTSGGIQATGNYPGRAGSPEELMADIDFAFSLIPGKKKLNLHASYAITDGEIVGRNAITPKHFEKWVLFAKERGIGLDFNPTFFSHPMVKNGLTLSSPDEEVRKYWVDHAKACIRISEYFAEETGVPCVMNIWIPDGFKDIPADRLSPRARLKKSLDEILDITYNKEKVLVTLESKVFGIGVESYTVGSAEFCLSYSDHKGIMPLMDNGHYHPTEVVSDKISSLLLFNEKIALHITRPVRWDSDHVVLFDDETKEIAKEIVRNDALDRVFISTDYFDASINRISAWVTGLPIGIPVAGGAGDNAAAAIGMGVCSSGKAFTSIGTSGVVFTPTDTPVIDKKGRIHTFCAAVPGSWHVMGVTQAAGLSLKWFKSNIMPQSSYREIDEKAAAIPVGCDRLLYLPYLMGERTPVLDSDARGVFFGLSAVHTADYMARAVLEGISYSLCNCLDVIREVGISVSDMIVCGGGGKSVFWQQMLADIYNLPVKTTVSDEGAALGAAILGGCAAGLFESVEEGCKTVEKNSKTILPNPEAHNAYMHFYSVYNGLYPALKDSFASLAK